MYQSYSFYTICIACIACGALMSAIYTLRLISRLRTEQFGQFIREDGPKAHLSKQGTPTMGGMAIFLTIALCSMIFAENKLQCLIMVLASFLFGLIGFLDDYLKIAKKQNLGLNAWQKLALQILFGIFIAVYMLKFSGHGSEIWVPFYNDFVDMGVLFVPFVVFIMVAMVNSVNLTDGLDGLSSGVTTLVCIFFGFLAIKFDEGTTATFAFVTAGACLGFLFHNRYPAKIFMGDTGSMTLGGAVAVMAIMMRAELFLPIAGLIYVLEALSVIIQVGSYKLRKKRVFRMAPIHHHFELSGMKEYNVVFMFWAITGVACIIAYCSTLI